ncbi:MAG TPA: SdrD B-like domain-containing protein [Gaiellaceae bacterium]|nr:SdrD B-like domain-containing protein [Gaiellaceae bacterium]
MNRFGLRGLARCGGGLAILALVALTVFVVLPSMASATPNWQPPASGTYNITPELVANGGQNNDCSFFYPGSTISADGTTVTLPSGQVLHQFYVNNPKNTTSATDPTTGAKFNLTVNTSTNQVTSITSTGAAIVDIGIKGGVNTTHYNYNGAVAQPTGAAFPFPGTVTGDTALHPPVSGTKNGQLTYYTVSHMSFCYTTGATASGTVFKDNDHDGVNSSPNAPDSPLAATVNLYKNGTFVSSTTSSASTGAFQFTNLTPGVTTYKVCVVKPASSVETVPSSTTANNTSCSGLGEASTGYAVNSSTATTGLNFGFAPTSSISGVAFGDIDGNHFLGSGEPGLNGLTVSLTDTTTNSAPVTTATANNGTNDGTYSFNNLLVGDTYKVCITSPTGAYQQSAPGSGVACSGINVAANGYSITLTSSNGSGTNFGFQPLGTLTGNVYTDVNGPTQAGPDGKYEPVTGNPPGSDTPLPNWTVTLFDGSGTQVGQPVTTDQTGGYSITVPFGTYTACVTPGLVPPGPWAQTEPLPTDPNSCATLTGLPKGQSFQPTTATPTVTRNFGVDQSEFENAPQPPCPPEVPFGADQTNGELQIKLAGCKPSQTFVFGNGTLADGSLWASVFAADQVVTSSNPEVPAIEKWVFPDPIKADGTPRFTHVDYTDVFPYDPAVAQELPECRLDPRDPSDPSGMTISNNIGGIDFTQDSNKGLVLPAFNPDGVTPATSCAISTRIYVDAQGNTRLEVYAYSPIDSWGKSSG